MTHQDPVRFTVPECPHGDDSPYSCPPCQNEALTRKGAVRAKYSGPCGECPERIILGAPIQFGEFGAAHAYH